MEIVAIVCVAYIIYIIVIIIRRSHPIILFSVDILKESALRGSCTTDICLQKTVVTNSTICLIRMRALVYNIVQYGSFSISLVCRITSRRLQNQQWWGGSLIVNIRSTQPPLSAG